MIRKPLPVFNYTFTNQGNEAVEIHIDGTIVDAETQEIYKNWFGDETSVSFRSFRNQVNESSAKTYNVYINSPGGQVIDAMAIHDLLVDLQAKGKTVNTYGRGLIASAATYILMASKNAEMSENSWMMIHNVGGGVFGDVNQIESYAGTLRKFNDSARDFYTNRTGIRKEDVTKMMNAETWMTAKEAKEKGFVNAVSNAVEFTNHIDREQWNFTNLTVLNSYNAAVKKPGAPENTDDMKKLFLDFSNTIANAINNLKPAEPKAGETAEPMTNEQLLQAIGTTLQTSFENFGTTMETTLTDMIATEVGTAVTNATKDLTAKITNLEKLNGELQQEIADTKAEGTKEATNTTEKKTVGKWN